MKIYIATDDNGTCCIYDRHPRLQKDGRYTNDLYDDICGFAYVVQKSIRQHTLTWRGRGAYPTEEYPHIEVKGDQFLFYYEGTTHALPFLIPEQKECRVLFDTENFPDTIDFFLFEDTI